MRESLEKKRARSVRILNRLREEWPDTDCTLDYDHAWQLLFSAILAAQCTDARVNIVTEKMYADWPRLQDYAEHSREDIEEYIKSCGLYRNKAKNIKACAEELLSRFNGEVPQTMEELLSLPGVGRKIANLMMGDAFGIPGVVVDTHCGRISKLMGMTRSDSPAVIERDLVKVLPEENWIDWGHFLVRLGREYCKARCRMCAACPVSGDCLYAQGLGDKLEALRAEGALDACC